MDEAHVLYLYKCAQCRHEGEVYLPGDAHDGAPHECSSCGAKVFLKWDGGVTFAAESVKPPIEEAQHWREEKGYVGRGGVVVVFKGTADAWVDKLRNPNHWQPGCIAVDESGRTWTAIGGTERDGALMWLSDDPILD
jgi:DNA-directed RNA polymerase subunit RPC12/RpoP